MRKLYNFPDSNLDRQFVEVGQSQAKHEADTSAHGAIDGVVGVSNAQTLVNKKLGTGSNNTEFEADGTPKFNGDATNWNDINMSLLPLATGANVPSIIAVNSATYMKVRAFNGVGTLNELGAGCELLHDYKEGSDIIPHVHWAPTTNGSGNVKWQLAYMWVERDGTFASETVISVTATTPGVAWKEQRSSFPAISGAGKHIGARFHFVLFRNPADAADTYAADAAAFDFGIHYERDTIGSRGVTSK